MGGMDGPSWMKLGDRAHPRPACSPSPCTLAMSTPSLPRLQTSSVFSLTVPSCVFSTALFLPFLPSSAQACLFLVGRLMFVPYFFEDRPGFIYIDLFPGFLFGESAPSLLGTGLGDSLARHLGSSCDLRGPTGRLERQHTVHLPSPRWPRRFGRLSSA